MMNDMEISAAVDEQECFMLSLAAGIASREQLSEWLQLNVSKLTGRSMKDETRTRLADVLRRPKDSLLYEYDFGDSWTHQVVLEKILAPAAELNVPQCIAGARACPPEDCGGVVGYAELLRVLKDPSHLEHGEMLEWVGGDYDANMFERELVNKQLSPRKRRR